jgi:hypothetical protein
MYNNKPFCIYKKKYIYKNLNRDFYLLYYSINFNLCFNDINIIILKVTADKYIDFVSLGTLE